MRVRVDTTRQHQPAGRIDHLRVADASIMPVIPSGNTNAACYMIGEVCNDLIP